MSDTLSLLVFAVCPVLAVQVAEIAIFVPFVLIGLSRLAAYILKKLETHEEEYFIAMLLIVAVTGALAQSINLPGIVVALIAPPRGGFPTSRAVDPVPKGASAPR